MKKGQKYFSKRCRLCGRCYKGSVDIFSTNEKNLQELIHQCLNINIREDDALPKKLCQYCDKKLLLWEKFKNSCENIQVKLIADSLPKKVDTPKSKKYDKVCRTLEYISGNSTGDNTSDKLDKLKPNHAKKNEFISSENKMYSESVTNQTENTAVLGGLKIENEAEDFLDGHESHSKAKSSLCKLIAPIDVLKHKQTASNTCQVKGVASQDSSAISKAVNVSHEACESRNSKAGILEITDQEINDLNDTISKNLSSEEKFKPKIGEINNNVNMSTVECKVTDSCLPKKRCSESKSKKTNKPSKEYHCSICNGKFHTLRKMKTHFKGHLSESNELIQQPKRACNKDLQCPHCPRKLSTSFNLRHHLETHSETCNYCCHLCGKLFRTHSSLLNHIRVHLCDEMEVQGKDSALLSNGRLVKLFQCQICDKKFRQSGHLTYHLKMHSGERLYTCSDCELSFREKYQLRKHVNAVHNSVKRYTCDVCGKQFLHTHNFKDHMLQHDGIANISCDLCGKAFITSNALNRHRRLHTGEKPFSCDICGKKFRDCSNRKRHRDKHIMKAEEALFPKKSKEESNNSLSLTAVVENAIGEESSDIPVQKISQRDKEDEKLSIVSEGEMEVKAKKTYMSLKTYFESNDEVSIRDEVKDGEELILPIESLVTAVCSHNSGLLQSIPVVENDDSSNSAPLLGCGLFGEELDLNSESLLLIGDGRVSNNLVEGAEVDSEGIKDQLVCWVPSSNSIQDRDVSFNGIRNGDVALSGIQNGDIGLAGIQVGDMGLSGVQGGDITGILEVGMGLCSDFDCHSAIGLDSAKDELSNDFPSIGEIKEVEEHEKGLENVLCLQVF